MPLEVSGSWLPIPFSLVLWVLMTMEHAPFIAFMLRVYIKIADGLFESGQNELLAFFSVNTSETTDAYFML